MFLSSCQNTLDYQGIACTNDAMCGGLKCVEGFCGGTVQEKKVVVTGINGTGSEIAPTYSDTKARPEKAREATHRFRKTWVLRGQNLDQLSSVKLRSKSNPEVIYGTQDGLLLQEGSAAEREMILPKNLMAGMFVLLGVIGTTEVALAEVFVLQGEGCKVVKSKEGDVTITCGTTQSTIKKETNNNTGSGLSAEIKAYLETLRSMLKLDSVAKKATFENVNVHITNGQGKTDTKNGRGNLIVGYNENPQAINKRSGSHNVVIGSGHSYNSYAGFVAGESNHLLAASASILGGHNNVAYGESSTVAGGGKNSAQGKADCIAGGDSNSTGAKDGYQTILGGAENTTSGRGSTVAGGFNGTAWSLYSSVFGGYRNEAGSTTSPAAGHYSAVYGGTRNFAKGESSVVVGGSSNQALNITSIAVGGKSNKTRAPGSLVLGGEDNTVTSNYATLLGGKGRTLQSSNTHTCNAACP